MSQTALVVEDDPFVRNFVVQVLKMQNFETIEAETESEGWNLFQEKKDDIVFIFTDVNLKEGIGWRLFKRIREETDSVAVVISSSFPSSDEYPLKDPKAKFLLKPFQLESLIESTKMIRA